MANEDKFDAGKFKYFIQPPTEKFIDEIYERLIFDYDLTMSSKVDHRYELQKFTKCDLTLHYKYFKITPEQQKLKVVMLNLDNLYFKILAGEQLKMVLFTDGMLIEFLFEEEESMMAWGREFTKYCVKDSLSQDYKLLDLVGKGGFGKVYKARDLRNGQIVALKVIEKTKIKTNKNYRYLMDEIKYTRLFNHPNMVTCFEVYDYRIYIVLVIEYVDGGTLKTKLDKQGTLTVKEAVGIMQDILEALSYIHSLNFVHRDLKPSNIMFATDKNKLTGKTAETLKLVDYGLCGNLKDRSPNSLIHDKCGTLGYLAPELLGKRGKDEFYGEKVDVFSAGILFFEMLNGVNPFKGPNYDESLRKNYRCDINLVGMAGSIPNIAIAFLKKLIERNPENRLSAQEALTENIFFKEIYDEGESQILSRKFEKMFNVRVTPILKKETEHEASKNNFSDRFDSGNLRQSLSKNMIKFQANSSAKNSMNGNLLNGSIEHHQRLKLDKRTDMLQPGPLVDMSHVPKPPKKFNTNAKKKDYMPVDSRFAHSDAKKRRHVSDSGHPMQPLEPDYDFDDPELLNQQHHGGHRSGFPINGDENVCFDEDDDDETQIRTYMTRYTGSNYH